MRLIIIEPSDSCQEMRGSIDAMLAAMQLKARLVSCPADRQSLAAVIATALAEAELVMVVGGMSHQGFAREAAADALERPLVHSKAAAGYIEQRCREQNLIFADFARCCHLPQGSKSFAGDGLFPACLCLHRERALLLFDEYDDPAQLFRLKTLLSSIVDAAEASSNTADDIQAPVEAVVYSSATPVTKPPHKTPKPSKQPRSARKVTRNRQKQAVIGCIAIGCVLAVVAIISVATALWGNSKDEEPAQAIVSESQSPVVLGPVREVPSWRLKTPPTEEDPSSSSADSSSSGEEEPASAAAASSSSAPAVSSSQAPASSLASVTSSSSASEVSSSAAVPSSTEPVASSVSEASSSEPEEETVYIYDGSDDEKEDEDDQPSGSGDTPSAHEDVFDEKLSYTSGGSVRRMSAYDLVCEVVQNETHGNLAPEALKAHVVATYTMIKYNNTAGIAPGVLLNSNVTSAVEDAVDAVLGVAIYYNGRYANTVYHSTSCGYTTSSQAVWGGALPYLTSVKSDYDKKSPYYKSSYTISADDLATKVKKVYGIALDGDPEDWISVEHDAPGGYVGTVEIGGETRSQGGTYGTGLITGRSVRERLLSFALRSHCFDVEYNASKDRFEFTVYGYGHGVGMSQYGAHYMALDGYNYIEILEHYYTDTEIY